MSNVQTTCVRFATISACALLAVTLAGCQGTPAPRLGEENTYWEVVVSSSFLKNLAPDPEDFGAQLPEGSGASRLFVAVEVLENPSGADWQGNSPCQLEDRPEFTVGYSCPHNDGEARKWVLGSSTSPDTPFSVFPLDDEGEVVLLIPRRVKIFLQIDGDYDEALKAKTTNPGACEQPYAATFTSKTSQFETHGRVRPDKDGISVSGPGGVEILWTGQCSP